MSVARFGADNPMFGKCGELNPFFGKHHTKAARIRMSKAHQGQIPWIAGKHHTDAAKKQMSIAHMGNVPGNKGVHYAGVQLLNLSLSHMGIPSPRRGKTHSAIAKRRMSKSHTGLHHSEATRRQMSESHRGSKCHLWRGGISFAPYSLDWTRALKQSIRERDANTCQLCGIIQVDEAPAVHHIDYDKKNCDQVNLVSLCRSCHTKTTYNREFWTGLFQTAKLYEKVMVR